MSKKLMTWEEMWEKLKASDPDTKVTFEMAEKVCKLYNSVEHKIIEDLEHRLEVAEKALELACRNNVQNNRFICKVCKNYESHKEENGCSSCCTDGVMEYFKEKAEREVKGE